MALKFHDRATLLTARDAKPFLREPVNLPTYDCELFFDIEVDPMRDICSRISQIDNNFTYFGRRF